MQIYFVLLCKLLYICFINMYTFMKNEVILGAETRKLSDLELRIKEVCKELGIQMQFVAEGSNVTKSYLSRIESGSVTPNMKKLQNIADVMGVPVHRLIVAPKGYGHFYIDDVWEGIRKK